MFTGLTRCQLEPPANSRRARNNRFTHAPVGRAFEHHIVVPTPGSDDDEGQALGHERQSTDDHEQQHPAEHWPVQSRRAHDAKSVVRKSSAHHQVPALLANRPARFPLSALLGSQCELLAWFCSKVAAVVMLAVAVKL